MTMEERTLATARNIATVIKDHNPDATLDSIRTYAAECASNSTLVSEIVDEIVGLVSDILTGKIPG